MKISALKELLKDQKELSVRLASGEAVPAHFHLTELGVVNKHFIDCGGTERIEKKANFQLWVAGDYEHRLSASRLLEIIELGETRLGLGDLEIEVEYQRESVTKYHLSYEAPDFILVPTQTNCLAPDHCGIPEEQLKIKPITLQTQSTCDPNSGCC